jgi:hypothetical protein
MERFLLILLGLGALTPAPPFAQAPPCRKDGGAGEEEKRMARRTEKWS